MMRKRDYKKKQKGEVAHGEAGNAQGGNTDWNLTHDAMQGMLRLNGTWGEARWWHIPGIGRHP